MSYKIIAKKKWWSTYIVQDENGKSYDAQVFDWILWTVTAQIVDWLQKMVAVNPVEVFNY